MTDDQEQPPESRWGVIGRGVAKILDHPRTALAVGLVGVVATVATFEVSQGGSSAPARTTSTGGAVFTIGSKPPPLNLNEGPSCSDLEQAAQSNGGRTMFVDSPGEIGGGAAALEGVLLPNGRYGEIVEAKPSSEVEMSARLHNGDYSSAEEVTLAVHVSSYHGTCWRLIGVVNSRTNGLPEKLGPTLIRLNGGKGDLEYVTGSTTLLDHKGEALVSRLADSVISGGIALPLGIPGGTTEYVNFRVRLQASR